MKKNACPLQRYRIGYFVPGRIKKSHAVKIKFIGKKLTVFTAKQ